MIQGKMPYRRMVFVCTHQRGGEAACANADRGEDSGTNLVELLREEVKKRGLKGRIRVAKSGCFDLCGAGPNIMIFDGKETIYLSHVTREDIPAIAEKYLTLP